MLNPSRQLSPTHGDAFDLSPLEGPPQRFDDGIVPAEEGSLPSSSRGRNTGGAVGYQPQVAIVGVRRPVGEEGRTVRCVHVRPRQLPVDVPRIEIPPPRIVVAWVQAPGRVADGGPGPRLGEGDRVGVGDNVLDGKQPHALAVVSPPPPAATRTETAHE